MEGYCLKDRKKVEMDRVTLIQMGNGLAASGNCPHCGTRMYKIRPDSADWIEYHREEDALAIRILGEDYFA
jgi:Domain of unknown function (DUF5679)